MTSNSVNPSVPAIALIFECQNKLAPIERRALSFAGLLGSKIEAQVDVKSRAAGAIPLVVAKNRRSMVPVNRAVAVNENARRAAAQKPVDIGAHNKTADPAVAGFRITVDALGAGFNQQFDRADLVVPDYGGPP